MQIVERDYQQKAADIATHSLVHKKNNEIIVAPTGSGKSIIIAGTCHRLKEPALILQPTKEILEQNYQKLKMYGIDDISMYSASVGVKEIAKYTYATIGSIYKNPDLFKHYKYVLLDECHLLNPKSFGKGRSSMYSQFFQAIGNPSVIGLSASPYRLVNRYFKDPDNGETYYTGQLQVLNRIAPFFFKSFAFNITNQTLFDKGYLAPLEYQVKNDPDFDVSKIGLNTTGMDFDQESLEKIMSSGKNVAAVVNLIFKNIDRIHRNLIFCSSIKHAKIVAEALSKLGLSTDVISSHDSHSERERKIRDFREGRIIHLCNVGVLAVGFDFPALNCVTLVRPTMSLALYYQMVGRVVRIDPDNPWKIGLVLDVTNNVVRMGRVETIRIAREKGGFKNVVETEVGIVSGIPLFSYLVKDKKLKEKLFNQ